MKKGCSGSFTWLYADSHANAKQNGKK